jgi:hypothetical protein
VALPDFRDHKITRAQGLALTQRQQAATPGAERGGMFHAQPVRELLAQKGCVGVRIYHGRNADGSPAMVLYGVDGKGNDLTEGVVLEHHYPCPPYCTDPEPGNG